MDAHYTLSATERHIYEVGRAAGHIRHRRHDGGERRRNRRLERPDAPPPTRKDPVISIALTQAGTQTTLAEAKLLLRVDGEGYLIEDDALTIH